MPGPGQGGLSEPEKQARQPEEVLEPEPVQAPDAPSRDQGAVRPCALAYACLEAARHLMQISGTHPARVTVSCCRADLPAQAAAAQGVLVPASMHAQGAHAVRK